MSEMLDQLKATDARTDAGTALGIVHTLLATADDTDIETIRSKLVELARYAEEKEDRREAFELLLEQVPGGRDALFNPILSLLGKCQFDDVVRMIGPEEPFVDSPNLLLWRAMAESGLGQYDRALADIELFLRVAPDLGPQHFAFRVAILLHTGADATQAMIDARSRLSEEGKTEYLKQLNLWLEPNNPFFPSDNGVGPR